LPPPCFFDPAHTLARYLSLYSSGARSVSLHDVQLEHFQRLLRLSNPPTFGLGTPPTCPPSSVFLCSCTTDVPVVLRRRRAQRPRTTTQLGIQQTMTSALLASRFSHTKLADHEVPTAASRHKTLPPHSIVGNTP